jgi:hypothetical protein
VDSFQEWLNSQLQEGQYHSSSGFTLDSLKARAKLGEFQLPPGHWVAKMVQAAVFCQAPRIDFKFARDLVTVEFDLNQELSARQILDKVLSGQLFSEGLDFHLITALRSCVSHLSEWVEWSAGEERIRLDPAGSHGQKFSSAASNRFSLRVGLPPRHRSWNQALGSAVSEWLSNTVEEHHNLRTRAWTAPIAVFQDGRRLNPCFNSYLLWHEEGGVSEVFQRAKNNGNGFRYILTLQPVQAPARPDLRLAALPKPHRFHKEINPIFLNQIVFRFGTFAIWPALDSSKCGLLALVVQRKCSFRVDFMLEGVMVDSLEVELPMAGIKAKAMGMYGAVGIRMWLAVRAQEVDLSHFHVRDKSGLISEVMPHLLDQVESMGSFVQENLAQLRYVWLEERHLGIAGVAALAVAAGLTVATGTLLPGAWLIGGNLALSPVNFKIYQSMLSKVLQALDLSPLHQFFKKSPENFTQST